MSRRWILLLAGLAIAVALGVTAATLLGDDEPQTTERREAPLSDASRSATVWAVGDGADGSDTAKRVADLIERGRPDRVLYLGDVYETGTAEEFEDRYRSVYGRFDAITAPTPGNHEWDNHEVGYDPYWKRANPGLPQNRHWYRFKIAGWELLSLNSEEELDPGSPQMRWLQRRVREPGTCRLAFMHRPYLNAGRHGDQKQLAPVWEALRGRAALVVAGHDHNFQHFKPRDGIVELVSGAGGHGRYPSDENDPRLVWDEDDEHGALRLDLRRGLARFRFVALDKGTIHRGSVRCRPKAG